MLKMLRALRRMEPVEKGTSFVAHTRDGENGEPIEIDRDTVLWGLSRLEPWPAPIFVNVYELDQSYGGPEEGGWWVSTQTPVASEQMVGTADVWEALVRLSAASFTTAVSTPSHWRTTKVSSTPVTRRLGTTAEIMSGEGDPKGSPFSRPVFPAPVRVTGGSRQ